MCAYVSIYICIHVCLQMKVPCKNLFMLHSKFHTTQTISWFMHLRVQHCSEPSTLSLSLFLSRSLLLSLFLSRLSSLVLFSLRPVLLKAVCTDVSHHFFSAPLLASCSKALLWKQCEQVRWSPPSNYWPGGFPPGEKTRTNITFVICIDRAML